MYASGRSSLFTSVSTSHSSSPAKQNGVSPCKWQSVTSVGAAAAEEDAVEDCAVANAARAATTASWVKDFIFLGVRIVVSSKYFEVFVDRVKWCREGEGYERTSDVACIQPFYTSSTQPAHASTTVVDHRPARRLGNVLRQAAARGRIA